MITLYTAPSLWGLPSFNVRDEARNLASHGKAALQICDGDSRGLGRLSKA
ncbi:hypothetical protein H6F73_05040 [Microcoleus sp. FACHB-68]|nr:hypothetical protein [Microcoleus sp. FACHB-68]